MDGPDGKDIVSTWHKTYAEVQTHDAIHVEVKVIKLHAIGVWSCNVNRKLDWLARDFLLGFLDNGGYYRVSIRTMHEKIK